MILILTDPGVGGTFLTWSLHYLAGHEKYFYAKSEQWTPLIDNPILEYNAHNFKPNQPSFLDQIYKFTDILVKTKTDNFHTLYFHNIEDRTDLTLSRCQPTADAISGILKNFKKLIVLENQHPLYNVSFKNRALTLRFDDRNKFYSTFEEQREGFIRYFFNDSLKKWQELKLTSIWDQREFLALNLRPLDVIKIKDNIDLTLPHYNLNSFDLYCTFDKTIEQLFKFLNIEICHKRILNWIKVYNQWKKLHYERMQFCWYFDVIIDYIRKGNDMDLTRFNLDIVQEACIQHHLIYYHDLNFKTWNLEKFINTKQLHNLLEKNIHDLEPILSRASKASTS